MRVVGDFTSKLAHGHEICCGEDTAAGLSRSVGQSKSSFRRSLPFPDEDLRGTVQQRAVLWFGQRIANPIRLAVCCIMSLQVIK